MSQIYKIYDSIQKERNITLSDREKTHIGVILQKIPKSAFHGYSQNIVLSMLVKFLGKIIIDERFLQRQTKPIQTAEPFQNISEYYQKNITEVDYEVPSYVDQLKQGDISLNSILGMTSTYTIQRLLNPESLLTHHYVCLDSRYRVSADTNTFTTQTWNYASTTNQRDGFIVTHNEIRNIKAIRIYQTRIPWDISTFPTMRCISVLFHEFANQSIITNTQRKFHFLMPCIWNSSYTYITGLELYAESNRDSIYEFQKPILTFDKLTYSLGDPYTLITIYHDRDTCTFTYGVSTLSIVCSKAHLFNNQTWVTITGFTTNNPSAETITIQAINSTDGHFVTVVDATTLSISAYFPAASITPTVGLVANVYFDRRRIFMPLEFICLK